MLLVLRGKLGDESFPLKTSSVALPVLRGKLGDESFPLKTSSVALLVLRGKLGDESFPLRTRGEATVCIIIGRELTKLVINTGHCIMKVNFLSCRWILLIAPWQK